MALVALVGLCGTALGCKPKGLPPIPPAEDAANADAKIPAYSPPPNPLERSAFEGQKMPEAGGHEHHKHGGHAGHGGQPASTDDSGHSGHGGPTEQKQKKHDH